MIRSVVTALAAVALGACTMLSAPAPLFTPADQDSAFALAEGLWVTRPSDCKVNPARSRPQRETCLQWAHVSRTPDGAWLVTSVEDADDAPLRAIIVPAAPPDATARAPLYVAETVGGEPAEINFAALIPRRESDGGAVTRLALVGVECAVVSDAWGPIAGIEVTREDGKIVRCTAVTKDGVREAARRAAIAGLTALDETDFLFVRRR